MAEKEDFAPSPMKQKADNRKREEQMRESSKIDQLFETEWEIFVAKLDRATGEFHTQTCRDTALTE